MSELIPLFILPIAEIGCLNEPIRSRFYCGKRVRWSSLWRRLPNLARPGYCRFASDGVNSIF